MAGGRWPWQNGQTWRSAPSTSPPSDSRGAQRRTKRDAAAKSGNSQVRPAVNWSPPPPRTPTSGPDGSRSPAATPAPALSPSAKDTDADPSDRHSTTSASERPTRTTSNRAPSRSRSSRARTRHGESPAARASPAVQTPPATRQIPWRTAAASRTASAGGDDPTAAAPATTAATTARRATYSAEAWPAMGRGGGTATPVGRAGRFLAPSSEQLGQRGAGVASDVEQRVGVDPDRDRHDRARHRDEAD